MTESTESSLTDQGILDLITAFGDWQREAGVGSNGGLWQMLAFLREAIESGETLYARMLERQRKAAQDLVDRARNLPLDGPLAAAYLAERLQDDPADLDYDCAFFVCGDYFDEVADKIDQAPAPSAMARYNSLFNLAIGDRTLGYWSVYQSKTPRSSAFAALARPVITDILHRGFPIPLFVDSMQMGLGAWDEGREIALQINKHITSAPSQGQGCSLYPPQVTLPIDWQRNAWGRDPVFLDYIDLPERGTQPLPDWVKAAMIRKDG